MRIAVAGGTGTVGVHVVERARARGHEVVVLARSEGVDVTTGDGLDAALSGVDAVIDVLSIATTKAAASIAFFETTTRQLLAAEGLAGVAHHVALSIVGIDRHREASGYYAGKAAQERAVAGGDVAWTILRATQFHEFARQMFARGKAGPLVLVPAMRSQPVAAWEVAERLVHLAESEPAGRARDLGGPRVERMAELSRLWGEAARQPGHVVEFPLPGGFGSTLRDGSLLADPAADLGTQTFTEWLAAETGVAPRERRATPPQNALSILMTSRDGDGGAAGSLAALIKPRERGPRLPEPSLGNVDELVRQLRDSGMPLDLEIEGEPRRLPIEVDETAFRVLQEGVSIVLMRVRGTSAALRIRYLPDAVEVSVAHAASASAPPLDRASGLTRTRKTVERLGGTVAQNAEPDGSFRVSARLPG